MFLKIGSEDHIKDLYENGTIFINTIEYFRRIEGDELRGDQYEGASEIMNSLPGTFQIPGIERTFNYEKVQLRKSYEIILGNIYSLYCISSKGFPNPLEFKMDERNMSFGSHCLMIKDNAYFFDSIEKKLSERGYKYHHGFVEYFDKDKANKKLSLFDKPSDFEYQKEFRFYVENDSVEPIKIQIGSLKDKSEIIETKHLTKLKLELRKDALT